jgi:hypothetical protein
MAGGGGLAPFPDTLKFYWSEDYGNTWHTSQTSPVIGRENFYWKALPADHEIIAMRAGVNTLGDKGKIFFSRDDGTTFSDVNRWDTTLLAYLNTHNDHTNNLDGNLFDYITVPGTSDIWIDIVLDTAITTDTTPYKLVTLLSTNAGYSWQAYTNTIPYFPHGDSANNIYYLQCIQGTSYVYLFTFNADPRSGNSFSFPAYGVNYLYSSDYGKTWNIDTSFSRNRKAHYVSAPGEVWCTATAHDSVTNAKPAYWITHTKDDGKNWYIDSVSLWNDGFYDGRDIAFTDPRHGWIFAQSVDRHISAIFKYLPPPKSDVKPDIYLFKQYGNRYANQINYTIHPNPANTETTIQLINGIQMTGIEFFDILGRKMLCPGIISEDQTSAVVRTDGLITGCYLAHVSLINGNYVVPFVVQH